MNPKRSRWSELCISFGILLAAVAIIGSVLGIAWLGMASKIDLRDQAVAPRKPVIVAKNDVSKPRARRTKSTVRQPEASESEAANDEAPRTEVVKNEAEPSTGDAGKEFTKAEVVKSPSAEMTGDV